jgi:hypothetical protein
MNQAWPMNIFKAIIVTKFVERLAERLYCPCLLGLGLLHPGRVFLMALNNELMDRKFCGCQLQLPRLARFPKPTFLSTVARLDARFNK